MLLEVNFLIHLRFELPLIKSILWKLLIFLRFSNLTYLIYTIILCFQPLLILLNLLMISNSMIQVWVYLAALIFNLSKFSCYSQFFHDLIYLQYYFLLVYDELALLLWLAFIIQIFDHKFEDLIDFDADSVGIDFVFNITAYKMLELHLNCDYC